MRKWITDDNLDSSFLQAIRDGVIDTGLGAEALHKLEALALERGWVDSIIETLDDGVAGWYQRIGYVLIAHIPRYCGPWNRHILLRSLAG
ncbi:MULTISPECIES: hypothetical protein [Pseudomonas syringae group]|uniref:Uncharacterized protein n=1 Tax=Pseudomonas syringae pv. ribicola TaxID=55398 RepID=A0A0P9ZGF2_PSESI|nr:MULTISPECIES: hypothetical protein [Pseudomonas syringae group]EKN48178.1 hypothetical protein AAI_02581 [Pseudomonas viridiflava UASWS0038]KPL65141.1 hypothetical protein PVFL_08135 [Pseudomonas viridiflava]KPY49847.1 Uncharacterized protein ALO47_00410 [Pseudomonas syringae pv. ribicola]KPZ27321.1 hypothetical protein ALO56_200039 [Pseudomonas viridiflava]OAG88091.1 hypothetical protein AO065_16590 [Pseudomonas viridiflava]